VCTPQTISSEEISNDKLIGQTVRPTIFIPVRVVFSIIIVLWCWNMYRQHELTHDEISLVLQVLVQLFYSIVLGPKQTEKVS
jgi:uncharacterized membrane protein (DUF106 family)